MTDAKTRQLKSGSAIDALAAGFIDAGVAFVTNYPGFHANELTDKLGCVTTSINENIAMAMAWGSAAAGVRSLTAFKNVGLNDAADPYLNAHVLSINAGLVIVVFDDIDDEHSQMRQDSRHYVDFQGGIWFEPIDKQDAYETALQSFTWSEQLQCPVTIRVTNILYKDTMKSGCYSRIRSVDIAPPKSQWIRKPESMVVHPMNITGQEERKATRLRRISAFVHAIHPTPKQPASERLVLTTGPFLNNTLLANCDRYHVKTYPIPERYIKTLLGSYRQVVVYEHGNQFFFEKIRALTSVPNTLIRQTLTSRRPNRVYHCRAEFEKLFAILRSYRDGIVVGDLGEYTMDHFKTISLCLSYGSSIAVATGVAASGYSLGPIFAVTGDGAFLHSGKNALAEALARKLKLTVIVFENGGCRGTGGQVIPGRVDDMPEGLDGQFADLNTIDPASLKNLIDRALDEEGVSIIILHTGENH